MVDRVGDAFTDVLNRLEASQVDYDLGSENVVRRVGGVQNGKFIVGAASYDTVVLPLRFENIERETLALLAEFVREGGRVVALDKSLALVDGVELAKIDDKIAKDWAIVGPALQVKTLDELASESLPKQPASIRPETNADNIFHQIRETNDALILFVCNVDLNGSASGTISWNGAWKDCAVERFDPLTGAITPFEGERFELEPCNSLALVVSKRADSAPDKVASAPEPVRLDPWSLADRLTSVDPVDDNVLVLDYLTVKLQDETLANEYFYRANGWFWKKKGYAKSPWDNGVQFKDELITKRFDDESGFELSYKFTKSEARIDDLRFVVENPSMFTVYCNGKQVEQIPNAWKFDRSFGVFSIADEARPGVNEMKLVADKSTLFTELMPAWIVGSFSLESEEQGFSIVADKGLTCALTETDKSKLLPRASSERNGVSWLTCGVGFVKQDDRAPEASFQFKEHVQIDALRIWNYCETNLSKRGVKSFELKVFRADEQRYDPEICQVYELNQGDGSAQTLELAQTLTLNANDKITFTIKSNWNGVEYPLGTDFVGTTEPEVDSAFVGLAEVKFLTRDGSNELTTIGVAPDVRASSELAVNGQDRRAAFLVDDSGLEVSRVGWAAQGRPFYSGPVDYVFNLDKDAVSRAESVLFELPWRSGWEGSVVAILLNGKQVGSIGWQGDRVELADAIREALNGTDALKLTVRVYGTPKNLFGPFHAGKLRGSAWSASFHTAPEKQPSGAAYDVIEYGLFSR